MYKIKSKQKYENKPYEISGWRDHLSRLWSISIPIEMFQLFLWAETSAFSHGSANRFIFSFFSLYLSSVTRYKSNDHCLILCFACQQNERLLWGVNHLTSNDLWPFVRFEKWPNSYVRWNSLEVDQRSHVLLCDFVTSFVAFWSDFSHFQHTWKECSHDLPINVLWLFLLYRVEIALYQLKWESPFIWTEWMDLFCPICSTREMNVCARWLVVSCFRESNEMYKANSHFEFNKTGIISSNPISKPMKTARHEFLSI